MSNINIAKIALGFVIAAEYIFTGTKRGAERKAWVAEQLYNMLPESSKYNLTQDGLETAIEGGVAEMKKLLQAIAD